MNTIDNQMMVRAIRDQKRELLRDWMDRHNLSIIGDDGSIDRFLEKSKDNVDFEFSFIGLEVHFYFFLEINKGAITIDSTFFEGFDFFPGSWETIMPEALVSFVSVGIFNYLGNNVEESDVVEKSINSERDLVIWISPSPSMELYPVTQWLKSRKGEIAIIIKSLVLDDLQRRLSWFDPVAFASIVRLTMARNFRRLDVIR